MQKERSMTSLSELVSEFDASSEFSAPPNWLQGRTVFGGLSAALALQAAIQSTDFVLPPLKCAQISFVGPAKAALKYVVQPLRQGKSATSIGVDCLVDGEVVLRAVFFFASERESRIAHDFSQLPPVGAPDEHSVRLGGEGAPAALSNFELRHAAGSLPISGAKVPELAAWVRHRGAHGVSPSVAMLALADSLPVGAVTSFVERAPFSTMTWTLDFPKPAAVGEWFLLRSFSQQAGGGYSFQTMQVWDELGELAISGCQTVALFA
jgi:acyl-CoA thioesterase